MYPLSTPLGQAGLGGDPGIPITGEAAAGKPEVRESAAANDLKVLFAASYLSDSNEVQR
jgi:hypothetical protein